MGETRRKFDADFKEGAVRLVLETGKPVAQVAREPRRVLLVMPVTVNSMAAVAPARA